MFIAKMATKYPDYHGSGYYNFIVEMDEDELNYKIEDISHDFYHVETIKTRHKSVDGLLKACPTKQELNDKYFKGL